MAGSCRTVGAVVLSLRRKVTCCNKDTILTHTHSAILIADPLHVLLTSSGLETQTVALAVAFLGRSLYLTLLSLNLTKKDYLII
jgi:hypothetical protein